MKTLEDCRCDDALFLDDPSEEERKVYDWGQIDIPTLKKKVTDLYVDLDYLTVGEEYALQEALWCLEQYLNKGLPSGAKVLAEMYPATLVKFRVVDCPNPSEQAALAVAIEGGCQTLKAGTKALEEQIWLSRVSRP